MKRTNPLASTLSIGFALLFLGGMAIMIWRSGSVVFSSGDLTAISRKDITLEGFASHAEFENQCRRCHLPLETTQDRLCIACHTNIRDQLADADMLHAKFPEPGKCKDCHPDHKGRDFNPTQAALTNFDHTLVGFSLIWHQVNYDATPMECSVCHTQPQIFAVAGETCLECHETADRDFMRQHVENFGLDCLSCHDGVDRMIDFDHSTTAYPLEGEHRGVNCSSCHQTPEFENTSQECSQCHVEPKVHHGVFSSDCAACHNPAGWVPASLGGVPFKHAENTSFSLVTHQTDYANQPINCTTCHPDGVDQFDAQTCITCHTDNDSIFMTEHQEQFGSACLDCHTGDGSLKDFDHDEFFTLDGRHAEIGCADCHLERVFKGTPTECAQCHPEPEIHAGFFGLQCQLCHTTSQWTPATLLSHLFPLDHGDRGEIDCLTCHTETYLQYTCDSCHKPAEMTREHNKEGIFDITNRCVECHPDGREAEDDD